MVTVVLCALPLSTATVEGPPGIPVAVKVTVAPVPAREATIVSVPTVVPRVYGVSASPSTTVVTLSVVACPVPNVRV